jgi:hypothetical protein
MHERTLRHRTGSGGRARITYERPAVPDRSALGLLRSTLAAAVGLVN